MLNASGSRLPPPPPTQVKSSIVGENLMKGEESTKLAERFKCLWLIASFFRNFLAYQVDTLRSLASEADFNALEEDLLVNCLKLQKIAQVAKASVNQGKDVSPNPFGKMMHNRQVRGVDGFVSRCLVRPPATPSGDAIIPRRNYQKYQEYIKHQFSTPDRPINQTFDASNTYHIADQLVAATAALGLQDTPPATSHHDYHHGRPPRSYRRAARLTDRSCTFDAPDELPSAHALQVQRQVSEQNQQRFNPAIWPQSVNPRRTFAQTNRLMAQRNCATSSSLPSSSQHTIDQQNSFSTSFDEPISLPANLPVASFASSVSPVSSSHFQRALPRNTHQLDRPAPVQQPINHFASAAFSTKRPSSSMEQRTMEFERQRQRYHLRQRHTSVEDYYSSQQPASFSPLVTRQNDLSFAKANQQQKRKKQVFVDKSNWTQPPSIGSDSELYSHHNHSTKSVLQTSDRAYYIHHYNHPPLSNKSAVGQQTPVSGGGKITTSGKLLPTPQQQQQLSDSSCNNSIISGAAGSQKKSAISISKKSLSLAGAKRRLGFKQSGLSAISVQRSEEVLPLETSCSHLIRHTTTAQSLSDSGTESSFGWFSLSQQYQNQQLIASYPAIQKQQIPLDPRCCFVEGLGAGQIASRQALVSPYLGDIQLALNDRRGMLEVDIIRARSLQVKAGAKCLPSPYVKVYLMKEKKCIAKCKTSLAKQTLDPLYQQKFIFREEYINCILQVIVWGDYGKKDRKSLMGIVQIHLDDLDISDLVIGWYKLFNVPSMTNVASLSSKALRHMIITKDLSFQKHQHQQQHKHDLQQQQQQQQIELSGDLKTGDAN